MRHAVPALSVLAVAVAVAVAVAGCGSRTGSGPTVLRLASPDPAGLAHQPAIAAFARDVERLSGGRMRIVADETRSGGGTGNADEPALLRDVARGRTDLGWAHARSLPAVGVDAFEPFDVPGLVDGYGVQGAVVGSHLAADMLAGVRTAGLRGLAVLAGPLSHPVGTRAPLRAVADYRRLDFGLRRSPVADRAVRALGARPVTLDHDHIDQLYLDVLNHSRTQVAYEDDLDSLFFERDDDARPWLTANVALWARPAVLVANPGRWRALTAAQRGWLARAAATAATASATLARDRDRALLGELCAAGVHVVLASPSDRASVVRAARASTVPMLRGGENGAPIRRMATLRHRAGPDAAPRVPPECGRDGRSRPIRSTLPDGVYRTRITAADVRAAGGTSGDAEPGTQTLTLRGGRWHLVVTEPGRYEERGTYTGTPLRTTIISRRNVIRDLAYVSVAVAPGGLTFHVGRAPSAFWPATFASHRWRRIGS